MRESVFLNDPFRVFLQVPLLVLMFLSAFFFFEETSFASSFCQSEENTLSPVTPLGSEVSIANMVIYSQEYMRYFFSDNDSSVQPLPASGMSLFLAGDIQRGRRASLVLTMPLREEEVRKKDSETFRYYYAKFAIIGLEQDFNTFRIPGPGQSCLRLSAMAGFALPLSSSLFRYLPPVVLMRGALEVGENVFLNFGFGYSGNFVRGAWFFPFGISYRLTGNIESKS